MWDAFGAIGKIVTAILGYYVTGTKTKNDLDAAFYAWAEARGRGNQSADDRQSVEDQRERIGEDRVTLVLADIDSEVKEAALKSAQDKVAKAEPVAPSKS